MEDKDKRALCALERTCGQAATALSKAITSTENAA